MKILRLAVMVIVFFSCQSDQKKETSAKENFQFVSGDLIFQDLDCGALCDAIESVTPGLNGQKFSHMGMFMVVNNKPFVVEAITPKVKLTRLDSFLNRSTTKNGTPKISVGRVKMEHKRILDKALRSVEKYVNQPYD
ncbi:MAG: hypothetical protein MRY83_16780, partial [Flavobacteriales bacterium]|nr:hypothetical protein [Flavobacteriales bacterium]